MMLFVEHANIARYTALLDTVKDPVQRQTIEKLLADEKTKLANEKANPREAQEVKKI